MTPADSSSQDAFELKRPPDDSPRSIDDSRVIERIHQYRAALEAGRNPGHEALLAEFPEIADELAACLEALGFVGQVVHEFKAQSAEEGSSSKNPDSSFVRDLGDYHLIRELGRGGMGVVYESEQLSLGRRVALKILPFAALLNESQLERFATEATAAARLQHAHIVPVYTVGCERGIHFYSMQLIEGPSLAEVIAELRQRRTADGSSAAHDQPDEDDTVTDSAANVLTRDADGDGYYRALARIGCEAAEALHYAHESGVLHRDIKPSNLLLDEAGHVWIADFGLARIEDESQLTRTGDILGTLRYMSPEQATGRRDKVDARSDVYSLGATLYELATLQPVFDNADRREVIKRVVAGNPVAPHKIDRRIPRPLSLVISRAMARRLDERYQSAQEMADDLQRFLDGETVKAKPRTPLRRARAWSHRHRLSSVTIAGLLIVVLLLPFLMHHFTQRVPDDSQTKGNVMKPSKAAMVAATVAAMAIVTAGVNAKKPPKPPPPDPDPGLTVKYELLGARFEPDVNIYAGQLTPHLDGFLMSGIYNIVREDAPAHVTRWMADGTVDTAFGNDDGGSMVVDLSGPLTADLAWDVAVQTDGKIVVVGARDFYRSPWIARMFSDGSLDDSFGGDGVVDNILEGVGATFTCVTLLSDGSIVAAGSIQDNPVSPLLVKFKTDGTIDTEFGIDGVSIINLGEPSIMRHGTIIELPDERFIAAGTADHFETSAVFMFNPDGSLDTSFGKDGLAEMDFERGQGTEYFHTLAVQPADGKIVAVGGTTTDPSHASAYNNDTPEQFSIARFNADGSRDRKFVGRGGKQFDLAAGGKGEFYSVAVLSDGRIIAQGNGDPGIDGTQDIYLARFQKNGSLDTSFDNDGWINLDIMGAHESASGLVVVDDHTYLIGGNLRDESVLGAAPYLALVYETEEE